MPGRLHSTGSYEACSSISMETSYMDAIDIRHLLEQSRHTVSMGNSQCFHADASSPGEITGPKNYKAAHVFPRSPKSVVPTISRCNHKIHQVFHKSINQGASPELSIKNDDAMIHNFFSQRHSLLISGCEVFGGFSKVEDEIDICKVLVR